MNDDAGKASTDDEVTVEFADRLDAYLSALQRGDQSACRAFLSRHPELRELADYLAGLHELAAVESFERAASSLGPGGGREVGLKDGGPGVPFGKFELLEEIGRGGMGVVYRARQTGLDRIVAVKMILSNRFAAEEEIRRFYLEARAAARLQHPNIVGIHDVGEFRGQHYFVMDHVEGRSLSEVLREGPMEGEKAAACMAAIARAVAYLHSQQIIHRDLKPSNILIDQQGQPHVTDFGLAKVFSGTSGGTCTGAILGTPSYMAPEQAAGRTSEISPRSDVYGLGAVLFEMLTGRPPYREKTPLDTLVQVLEGEATLPTRLNAEVPPELELICLKCLEKNPEDRYASAAALADDLERYLRKEPVDARPAGVWPNLRRWSRREPALVFRLLALAVAVGIVQFKFALSGTDPAFHQRVLMLFGGWALGGLLCQKWLNLGRFAGAARAVWSAVDVSFLTAILAISDPPVGWLAVGYPCLIAAAGLFFEVRLVLFTTCACAAAFGVLQWLRGLESAPPHYPSIFAGVLVVHGLIVAYQVHRVRALSRYFESRRWS